MYFGSWLWNLFWTCFGLWDPESGWHQSTFPALQLQLQDSTIAATKAIFCQLALDCKVLSFEYCRGNYVAPHCNALAPRSKAERPFLSSCPHKQGSTFQILHQLGCFGCRQLTCRPAKNRQEPRHPASIEKISKSKCFLQGSNLKILWNQNVWRKKSADQGNCIRGSNQLLWKILKNNSQLGLVGNIKLKIK